MCACAIALQARFQCVKVRTRIVPAASSACAPKSGNFVDEELCVFEELWLAEEIVMRVAPLSYMSADAAWWETVYSIELSAGSQRPP
jgi:hypothetical protein